MDLTSREALTIGHGMIFGALFLLTFGGGMVSLYSLRPEWLTVEGLHERMIRLKIGVTSMALVAWVTVVTGTYVLHPWYRAKPPAGAEDLTNYPRSLLLSNPDTADLHRFAMEWKEHVAWTSPILASVAAFIVLYYGNQLIVDRRLRWTAIAFFVLAFSAAGVAGAMGALIARAAPLS